MANKDAKTRRPKGSAAADAGGVLASLPATRPARIGGERGEPAAQSPKPATKAKATAKPKAKPRASAKPKAAPAKPKAAPKPAPAPEPVLTSAGADTSSAAGPRPVRPASPELGTGPERPAPDQHTGPPSGTELVTTAFQAAGELAQIGLTVGGHILKRAVDRLPKP